MSNSIDNDLDLDLHFLPSWAKEPSNRNLYADFEGEREGRPGRDRGDRPFRRRPGGPSQDRQGPRPPRSGPRPEGDDRRRGPRREGRPGEGRWQPGANRENRPPREARPPKPEELPQLKVAFRPEEKGVDSLARQIKMTGRAYPLFGVAQMVLARPERHTVTFSVIKGPEGQVLQPLFVCALDDSLWLSEQDAVDYVLDKHFATFYQEEKAPIEPPKGTYTFVAQCGMSGIILGPPNHHDYQNQLHRLHAERFSRMPFETFKSRVKIVRDEAVIKKWIDSQSWRTEYVCLNLPEPLRLGSMDQVRQHFRETHLPNMIKAVESHTMNGAAGRNIRSGPLVRLVRAAWEEQKRFPLQVSTVLSQQFASRGLQFFKVNKNITHVAVARPHFLDLALEPVSDGVRRIVEFVNAHPRCTRRQLFDALAPAPAAPVPVAPAEPAAKPPEVAESPAPGAGTEAPAVPEPSPSATTPEATALISDLHWLIHQGHVIEFADGLLETAKKPVPKPPKPQPQPAVPAAAEAAPETPAPASEAAAGAEPAASGSDVSAPTAEPAVPEVSCVTQADAPAEPPVACVPDQQPEPSPEITPAAPPSDTPGEPA